MKHLLKILLLFFLSTSLFLSCTSSKDDEDGEVMADSEMLDDGGESLDDLDAALDGEGGEFGEEDDFAFDDGEGEFSDDEFADDEFADDGFADDEFADDEFSDDEFAEGEGDDFFAEDDGFGEEDEFAASDDFAEAGGDEAGDFVEEPLEDDSGFADDSGGFADDSGFSEDDSFADSGDSFGSEDAGFSEVDSFDDSGSGFAAADDGFEEVEPERDWVPVKKMATTPFQKGGQLLNTIYIIRPGDTMESVSQKIYGADRSQDLYAANPHLHRSFTVGDKMYYNSPNRPNDSNQIITYYEDVGIPAQTYVSQEGDNIRQVAAQLMGHPDSWKEMWAINMNVESKGQIPGGLELRYFPEDAAPSQTIAQNNQPAQPEGSEASDSEPEFNDQAMNEEIPPPPPAPGEEEEEDPKVAAGSVQPPPPPPPKIEPPPPPPAESQQQAKVEGKDAKGIFSNMKLILAAILLIGGGLAILVIQKNKSKKINIGETQI